MGNLEKKLGEIRFLKQEWDIGSKDAYDYLKSQEELTAFRKNHESEGALNFTNRQIVNIADELASHVQNFLDFCSHIYADKKQTWPRENFVQKIAPTVKIEVYQKTDDNIWICDYDSVFSVFLQHYSNFSKKSNNQKAKIRAAFNYTLAEILFTEIPILYSLDEKPHLITQIASDDNLMLGSKKFLFGDSYYSDAVETAKDALADYGWLAKMDLTSLPFHPELDVLSRHEYKHLLSYGVFGEKDDSYDRAVKELTLKRQDTQRRIALNYLLHLPEDERKIDEVYSSIQRRIQNCMETISKYEQTSAPLPMIQGAQYALKKRVYMFKAIKNNRKWLEQMLSH